MSLIRLAAPALIASIAFPVMNGRSGITKMWVLLFVIPLLFHVSLKQAPSSSALSAQLSLSALSSVKKVKQQTGKPYINREQKINHYIILHLTYHSCCCYCYSCHTSALCKTRWTNYPRAVATATEFFTTP